MVIEKVADRYHASLTYEPSSKMRSKCGWRKPVLRLRYGWFRRATWVLWWTETLIPR